MLSPRASELWEVQEKTEKKTAEEIAKLLKRGMPGFQKQTLLGLKLNLDPKRYVQKPMNKRIDTGKNN